MVKYFFIALLLLSMSFASGNQHSQNFPHFNLETIPFSRAGSFYYIGHSWGTEVGELSINTSLRGAITYRWDGNPSWSHNFFRIKLYENGKQINYETEVSPWELKLITNNGEVKVRITFSGTDRFLFECNDIELHLEPYRKPTAYFQNPNGEMGFILYHAQAFAQLKGDDSTLLSKDSNNHIIYNAKDRKKNLLALWMPNYQKEWELQKIDFEKNKKSLKNEVEEWMKKIPNSPDRYSNTTKVAWYLMWDLIVNPYKNYTRRGILMSKWAMNQIWAWDNCINGVAVVNADPDLAWDQLLMFFDKQTENGAIPDPINDYQEQYGFTKPPIYGWAVLKFIEQRGVGESKKYLEEIYEPLIKYTEWWMKFRDTDQNGLCEYNNGNDSGWDNATAFDQGYPVEGPDLAAHLIIQMNAISKIANILGKSEDAELWKSKSETMYSLMIERFLTPDNKFLSPMRGRKLDSVEESNSLINYIPIELGGILSKEIHESLQEDINAEGKFMTKYGLATQAPSSPKYEEDGYWRGPIWSPSTLLIFDGLVDAGYYDLAAEIADRFCKMCAKDDGFWENYNALTGKGLRDKGYSWTAAGYLIMAEWLYKYESNLIN